MKVTLSASYLKSFLDAVLTFDATALTNIDIGDLTLKQDGDNFIDANVLAGIFAQCESLILQPGFGVKLGSTMQVNEHGLLSYILMGANTHGDALQAARRYLKIRSGLFSLDISEHSNDVILSFNTIIELLPYEPYIAEAAMAGSCQLLKTMYQASPIKDVHLTMNAPADVAIYKEVFGNNLHFNATQNCIVLDKAWVNLPAKNANPLIFAMAQRECEELLAKLEGSSNLADKIRYLLQQQPGLFPDQECMADKLAMSPRSLRRHLQELGLTYHQLLDEARCAAAITYLQQQRPLDEVADLLGYSETSNFLRAFKRWTGKSASTFVQN